MTGSTQTKQTPVPAVLVYGTPTSPDLTQASWFRAEDKQAAKAAAETLKFAVIDINTDAEKALTIGVHEGVLKGSGRMIVGSVSTEVYRRIEDYVRKAAGAEGSPTSANTDTAAAKPASEQNMNLTTAGSTTSAPPPKTADAASPDSNAGKVATSSTPGTALSTATENKPQSAATSAASPTGKPENTSAAPDPWDALRVGSHVVGKYWLPSGEADGWWIGVITGIDKNDFIIRWPDEPKTPPSRSNASTSPFYIPLMTLRGNGCGGAEFPILTDASGRPWAAPFIWRSPADRTTAVHPHNPRRLHHDQHDRIQNRPHPFPQ